MLSDRLISRGFVAAGLFNIVGIATVTAGFTDTVVADAWPEVFGGFGQIAVVLWGLAYLSVARTWRSVPWLCAVFAVEKAVYVGAWVVWHTHGGDPGALAETSPLAAFFYAGFGPGDLLFGVLFAVAAVRGLRGESTAGRI